MPERVPASIGELLLTDHRRLHDLLARALDSGPVDAEAYRELRQGLLRHIAIEEKLLFRAAAQAVGSVPRWWVDLRIEHAALTSLLVPTPDVALLTELRALLCEHDAKEEGPDGAYRACERVLAAEQLRELARAAAALPPLPLAPNFDGSGVYRTRAAALAAAARARPARRTGGS